MKKKVLLVSPDYMGLYEDIKRGLESLHFDVLFIPQEHFPDNPYNVVYGKKGKWNLEGFNEFLKDYWIKKLSAYTDEQLSVDYLLVIDGLTFHPYLIERLRQINPSIIAINYLFDRIKGVYQIDHNFTFFDRVYSFDRSDAEEFNLRLLPIYWVPCVNNGEGADVFGFGAFDPIRLTVFKRIRDIIDGYGVSSYIKLYYPPISNRISYQVKSYFKYIIKGEKNLSLKELDSDLFTNKAFSTNQFRDWIGGSKVIIDTNHPYQDGLTARFMWALGAGKKIITNNIHAKEYDFYTEDQILVIDNCVGDDQIMSFILNANKEPFSLTNEVLKYRIDNWLSIMLYENIIK